MKNNLVVIGLAGTLALVMMALPASAGPSYIGGMDTLDAGAMVSNSIRDGGYMLISSGNKLTVQCNQAASVCVLRQGETCNTTVGLKVTQNEKLPVSCTRSYPVTIPDGGTARVCVLAAVGTGAAVVECNVYVRDGQE